LDLDLFKNVNDALGHGIGDDLLKIVAQRLRACVPSETVIARLGGDEFAILLTDLGMHEKSLGVAHHLIEEIGAPYEIEGHEIVIGTSIGIAFNDQDNVAPDVLLKQADMALYRAKADGRGAVRTFEPAMDEWLQDRRSLETDIRKAWAARDFEIYYQPQVCAATKQVCGFEALLRWNHPDRGAVPPSVFIPVAEDIGLILPLGEWVLERACTDAAGWPERIGVAVNLSPVQFRDRGLLESVGRALNRSGLAPNRLELEITERVLLQKNEVTLATLHKLRTCGVRIAMDDFGTGYSSLKYLSSFPFDKIKIDRSFVRDMSSRAVSSAIVQSVTTLGSSLRISTTAEGVETEDQYLRVLAAGCTEIQGYYFGEPKPVAELVFNYEGSEADQAAT
jgi:diguanylate cyclase (GGDEF)-like protein